MHMATYMIGYDLHRPEQDYARLIDALKEYGTWWHYLDSTWLVVTPQTAQQIRDNLRQFIDGDDELLVLRVKREAAWAGFSQHASDWLKTHLSD